MTANKKEISLLPDAENPNSLSSRLVLWLTTVGRYVIVITELIVITAFVSRFWLDRKNSDLSEIIRQQEAILTSTKSFEKEFLNFQEKLTLIKNNYQSEPDFKQKILSVVESTPKEIIFKDMVIKKANKDISANLSLAAYREESIVNYITNLILNPDIKSVDINKIEKKPKESSYSLSIDLIFNPTPKNDRI